MINPFILGGQSPQVQEVLKAAALARETNIKPSTAPIPYKPTAKGMIAAAVHEKQPSVPVKPKKAEEGLIPNLFSAGKFMGFGLGGGAAITAVQLATGAKPTATDIALTQAGASAMGLPAAGFAYEGLIGAAETQGVTGIPEIGVPSVAPAGQQPLFGEISFQSIAPPTIADMGAGVGEGLGLPDLGNIKTGLIIAAVAIGGLFLAGKYIGRGK